MYLTFAKETTLPACLQNRMIACDYNLLDSLRKFSFTFGVCRPIIPDIILKKLEHAQTKPT